MTLDDAAETHAKEMPGDDPETPAFYQQIGGAQAVKKVVDDLYLHALRDEQLSPYFDGTDLPALKRHMVLMLTKVLGGPDNYAGRELAEAHQRLDITGDHYERVRHVLLGVLWENRVGVDVLMHVAGVLTAVKEQIVRQPSGELVRKA
ncbi:group I truncated hemoglobin [Streptomyces sp. AF1A]|uniref:group I truncated hemoglobin n=1 Tax=Streptomyces sp. AF1A TaxID=3394350 RepID=UPI0039BC6B02